MSEPLRAAERPDAAPAGADRDARVEQLLLAGLDHYFAGEIEQAINLWTRVLFLDRQHDRARAYIERARSAQAEQQRESEALVHQGLEAFDAGDVARARALLRDAVARGAAVDEALGVLGRIDRLGRADRPAPPPSPVRRPVVSETTPLPVSVPVPAPAAARPGARWALVAGVAAGALAIAAWGFSGRLPRPFASPVPAAPVQVTASSPVRPSAPLPVPPAMEHYLESARAAFNAGRLRDGLRLLDRVPVGDPSRADADRLRARIQRELLAVAAEPSFPSAPAEPAAPAPPPE